MRPLPGLCRLLRFAHGGSDGEDGDVFVAQDFDPRRCFHLANMDGLANFQVTHVGDQDLRQILGQGAHFKLEENVFKGPAAGLDAEGFAGGLDGDLDGDFFRFGNFVQVNVTATGWSRRGAGFPAPGPAAWAWRLPSTERSSSMISEAERWDDILDVLEFEFQVARGGGCAGRK